MMQVVKQSREDLYNMYMKYSKEELASMLAERDYIGLEFHEIIHKNEN